MKKISYYEKEADIPNYTRFVRENNSAVSGRVSNGHFHSSVELVYVLEGRHEAFVGGEKVTLEKDDIVLFNPYDIHYYNYVYDNALYVLLSGREYWVNFKSVHGNKVFPNVLTNREHNGRVRGLLDDWFSRYDYDNFLRNVGYVDLLADTLCEAYAPTDSEYVNRPDVAFRMLEYINDNFRRSITLNDLAGYMGYNITYCSQLFGKLMRSDFKSYLNNIRVMNAWHEMVNAPESRTVTEIAASCGFESLNTFYRAFGKRFGRSPTEMLSGKNKL